MSAASLRKYAAALIASTGLALLSISPSAQAAIPNFSSGKGIAVTGITPNVNGDPQMVDVGIRTAMTNDARGVRVILPASYDANPGKSYPVLYLLHGVGADHSWWTLPSFGGDAQKVTKNSEAIIVMPDGGGRGWYLNWVGFSLFSGPQNWETFHLDQLIPWIDQNLRTIHNKQGRAIAGLSMGGSGVLRYVEDRPDLFNYAAIYSGTLDPQHSMVSTLVFLQEIGLYLGAGLPTFPGSIFGGEKAALDPTSSANLAKIKDVNLEFYMGESGGNSSDADQIERDVRTMTKAATDRLKALGTKYYLLNYGDGSSIGWGCKGGHTPNCWTGSLEYSLPRMLGVLQKPQPTSEVAPAVPPTTPTPKPRNTTADPSLPPAFTGFASSRATARSFIGRASSANTPVGEVDATTLENPAKLRQSYRSALPKRLRRHNGETFRQWSVRFSKDKLGRKLLKTGKFKLAP